MQKQVRLKRRFFSIVEEKNAGIAIVMASIFNEEYPEKSKFKCRTYSLNFAKVQDLESNYAQLQFL